MKPLNYRPEIDGLRAIAVLSVLLYHAGFQLFSGGYVGVDIFFVISGFLITSILVKAAEKPSSFFSNFYESRIRRLFPALFFLLFTSALFSIYFLPPYYLSQFGQSLSATSLFMANILFWWEDGYFDFASEFKPLLHMWSLGVEEQFYILMPLIILICIRRGVTKTLFKLILILFFLSFCLSIYEINFYQSNAFYLLPSRFWELSLGSICALINLKKYPIIDSFRGNQMLEFIFLMLIIIPVFAFTEFTTFPSYNAIYSTVGTAGIILFSSKTTWLGKFLSIRLLTYIGLISYSLYIWHYPIISISKFVNLEILHNKFFLVFISILAAIISYHLIEKPFRNKKFLKQRTIFIASAIGIFLFSSAGYYIYKGNMNYIFESREVIKNNNLYKIYNENLQESFSINYDCKINTPNIDEELYKRVDVCLEQMGDFNLIFGDSHAIGLANIFHHKNFGFNVGLGKGGCRLNEFEGLKQCKHYGEALSFIDKYSQNISNIIFTVSGSEDYLIDWQGNTDSIAVFDEGKKTTIHKENIAKTIQFLQIIKPEINIIWVGPYTEAQIDIGLTTIRNLPLEINKKSISLNRILDSQIKVLLKENTQIKYFSFVDDLEEYNHVLFEDQCILFRDRDHFSRCGEMKIARKTSLFSYLESINDSNSSTTQ